MTITWEEWEGVGIIIAVEDATVINHEAFEEEIIIEIIQNESVCMLYVC